MKILQKKYIFPRKLLIYRKIRHSKGHGVHSPFAFNLITKVIREKASYYRIKDIELLRKRMLQNNQAVSYLNSKGDKVVSKRVADIIKKQAVSPKTGALLFRLANYFKPRTVLQIGPSMGFSSLFMVSYAPDVYCVSIEPDPYLVPVSQMIHEKGGRSAIDQRTGNYEEVLAALRKEEKTFDFIFFNVRNEQHNTLLLFRDCMLLSQENTVYVIDGIRAGKSTYDFWKEIISLNETTISMDLYSVGIVFQNKKLHKRTYKVYF